MNRPKSSSRLLSSRSSSRTVVTTVTTSLGQDGKVGDRRGRATSARRAEKLPSLAKINREIMDKSAELLGQRGMEPHTLVDWIKDKRGKVEVSVLVKIMIPTGKLCCIYMKYDNDRATPGWHPYRYQVIT